MTAVYRGAGIEFAYPENWKLQKSESAEWPHEVSIHNPDGAFWSATIYPDELNEPQLAAQALNAMREEYENLESDSIQIEIGQQTLSGHELRFYCLDFLIACHIIPCNIDERSVLLVYQADDRDFEKLKPIFAAITLSMLQQDKTWQSETG